MIDEKGETAVDCSSIGGDKHDGVYYPMYFGVSCAFGALHLLSSAKEGKVTNMANDGWTAMMAKMLEGSAQLLGMLVWNAQRQVNTVSESDVLRRLGEAQTEIQEMKRRRREDAKANARVVAIYASQEQSWLSERRKLIRHLQSAVKSLHELQTKNCADCAEKEDAIYKLNEALVERQLHIEAKIKILEEEERKRVDAERKLERSESVSDELREMLDKEAQEHSSEIWKHKTTFVELLSSQRQLEAEMARVLRQVEAAKMEFDALLGQKEEAVAMADKVSRELVRMQRDGQQKDKIVSAMLWKFKLDSTEKKKLMKELKIMQARKRQTELEIERLTNLWESKDNTISKHGKNLRNVSSNTADFRSEIGSEKKALLCIDYGSSHNSSTRNENLSKCTDLSPTKKQPQSTTKTLLVDYLEPELCKGHDRLAREVSTWQVDGFDTESCMGNRDPVITTSVDQLEDLVQLEIEKYTSIVDEKHDEEIEAFVEQMRLKDEKLEAFRWQILSMELESKRLKTRIDELNENLSQVKGENIRLEALLLGKEKDLKSINERYTLHIKSCQNDSTAREILPVPGYDAVWSEVTVIKRKPRGKEEEQKSSEIADLGEVDSGTQEVENRLLDNKTNATQGTPVLHRREPKEEEKISVDMVCNRLKERYEPTDIVAVENVGSDSHDEVEQEGVVKTVIETSEIQMRGEVQKVHLRKNGREEKSGICKGENQEGNSQGTSTEKNRFAETFSSSGHCMIKKEGLWKMDIHALGVSFKIKRLKQKLFIIERLTETHTEKHSEGVGNSHKMKGLLFGVNLLKKQLKRYQSLEEKADDLCKRMHSNHQIGTSKGSNNGSKDQTRVLEQFLEEAFQLQRYMVATGQKLAEIMSETTCALVGSFDKVDGFTGVDVKQFADGIRTLLKEIQRGLEVRISRVIGDVEGTLACEGMILHLRK